MALDYAPHRIRVNAVCPGRIATDMPRSRLGPGDDWEAILAAWGKNIPLGRVGRPEDVAQAILFLASDESAWITGTTLVIDGGATIAHPHRVESKRGTAWRTTSGRRSGRGASRRR
jgi:NAD(P)-dependent dehydrogenase (short-subunit alcohol dehydrogenase family)